MSDTEGFVCIGCPIGCPLQLEHEGKTIVEISGNDCKRGAKYARQEFTDPRRALSTTVAISCSLWRRLPVKTTKPIPKERVMEAARVIHEIAVEAPVEMGQVLIAGLLGEEGVDVVASRSMSRVAGLRGSDGGEAE
jgi:CxxC motif-containing protein